MNSVFDSFKKSRWFPLIIGILLIILGVICVANPAMSLKTIAIYIAVTMIVYAVVEIIAGLLSKDNKKDLALKLITAVILIVIATLTFANMSMVGKYLPVFVGFFMFICGIIDVIYSLVLLKNKRPLWWSALALGAIIIVLGLIFIMKPGFVGQFFGILTGIGLIVIGVSNVLQFILLKK